MMRAPLVTFALLATLAVAGPAARGEPATDGAARVVARALAEAVTARDAAAAAALFALPANLDGEVVTTREALRRRWEQSFAPAGARGLELDRIEILRLAEAIERHGPPPARLGTLDDDALVAILRWNRALLVAVIARREDRWAVVAVTD